MKSLIVTFIVSLFVCSACSEKIGMTEAQMAVCGDLDGRYTLTSVIWNGIPSLIDIAENGVAVQDLYDSFMELPNIHDNIFVKFEALVQCNDEYPETVADEVVGRINLTVPIQEIGYSPTSVEKFSGMFGYSWPIDLKFCVTRSGNLYVDTYPGEDPEKTDKSRIDVAYMRNGKAEFPGNGEMIFSMNCMYYDYATEQIVTGPVEFIYKKYL